MAETPHLPGDLGRRYRILERLKDASGVLTFAGEEIASGIKVIIKTVDARKVDQNTLVRFVHEARALTAVRSDFIAPLRDYFSSREQLCSVMPFIDGPTLRDRLSAGPLPWRETLEIARGLFSALADLHDHGVLHRDIKPENLILPRGAGGPSLMLIDLGLAGSSSLVQHLREQAVGTVLYMSPEQAGMIAQEADARSDLYSAGIVLFECLSGATPFKGREIGEVIRAHLSAPLPAIASDTEIPAPFADVIELLLRKQPRDRYQSARGVLADLDAIHEATHGSRSFASISVGLHDRRGQLISPLFIGREEELSRLLDGVQDARRGRGGVIRLETPSGGGKTRLLVELARRCAGRGTRVYHGQGVDQVAQRPFELLAGMISSIAEAAESDPELRLRLTERLEGHALSLCSLFPELRSLFRLDDSAGVSPGPEDFGEERTVRAMSALLDALGTDTAPAAVLLDDCQWSDEVTLKLLRFWSQGIPSSATPVHTVVVLAFRTEEISPDHPLRRLPAMGEVIAPSLSPDEIRSLAYSMAGEIPDAALAVIHRLSDGSPFMAMAILRGLVESDALRWSGDGWTFDNTDPSGIRASVTAATFLKRRFSLLPEGTLSLLQTMAVLGKEFDLDLAVEVDGRPPEAVVSALDEAQSRQILWKTDEGRYSFFHDKLRESLLGMLNEDRRRALHLRAAERIEKRSPDASFELAYHYDAAGDSVRALPYAMVAARAARGKHSLEVAERLYRIAKRGAPRADRTLQYEMALGLGEVLMMRGRYSESRVELSTAGEAADTEMRSAEIDARLGELSFKQGDVESASRFLERGLKRLGIRVPSSSVAFAAAALKQGLIQCAHTLFPGLFLARRPLDSAPAGHFLVLRLLSRLAYAYWFGKGKSACLWAHLYEMNLAECYPKTLALAQAYSEHGPAMTLVPYLSRAIRYVEKSLAIRREFGDLWGQGQSLSFFGVALYAGSRYEECIEKCRDAVRIMDRTGDRWELNTAQWHVAYACFRLGQLKKAVELSVRLYDEAIAIGDYQSAAICLAVQAKSSGGRVSLERIRDARMRIQRDASTLVELLVTEGIYHIGQGDLLKAAEVLEEGRRTVEDARQMQEYVASVYPWLATVYRRAAEEAGAYNRRARARHLRKARSAVRAALRFTRRYPNNLPHALREAGLVDALLGKRRSASRKLQRSIELAGSHGARYEQALSELALAAIGKDGSEADAVFDRLQKLGAPPHFDTFGLKPRSLPSETPSVSMIDRFDKLIDFGRRLASCTSRNEVHLTVEHALRSLLRPEKCLVFEVEAQDVPPAGETPLPPLRYACGDRGAIYSSALIQTAVKRGTASAFTEGPIASPSDSLVLTGVRSVLCAPILIRGQVRAVAYVSHKEIRGLFGEDEERIAQFVSTIAGGALENVENIENLRVHTDRLIRSNAELERFAYAASHDLREPLRNVTTFAELLETEHADRLDDSARSYLRIVREGGVRMQDLVDGLLRYSRIDAADLQPERVDIGEIVRSAVDNLRVHLDESGGQIRLGEMPEVLGVPFQLTQVFQNIIANSIKFRSARPLTIDIRAERTGDHWEFSISDNGKGFDPRFSETVFVIFKRLQPASEAPGSGIGLAICKKIIERHGGKIRAEGRPGEGAEFRFTLAAAESGPQRDGS